MARVYDISEHVRKTNTFIKEVTMKPRRSPKTGTRREQQKAETKALILDAARRLFEERGFDGTTMRELAAEAGVGLGTIFAHFPDKGALLMAALLDDLAETDRRIVETLPAAAPIRDQILHVAAAGIGYWCRRPELSSTLLRQMWFVSGPWADRRRDETDRFIEFVSELLEAARERGELRGDVDLRETAEAMYSFYLGRIVRAVGDEGLDAEALLRDMAGFVDQLLEGIGDSRAEEATGA
jgi:AcrR family transcriptional regulator